MAARQFNGGEAATFLNDGAYEIRQCVGPAGCPARTGYVRAFPGVLHIGAAAPVWSFLKGGVQRGGAPARLSLRGERRSEPCE